MSRHIVSLLCAVLASVLIPAAASAREVTFPVHPDTAYLRHVIVSQMFTGEGETARVWDDGSGCNFMVLSDPRVATGEGVVHLTNFAEARVGQRIGSRCLVMSEWSGTIETTQTVEVDPGGTAVRFQVVDSRIQDEAVRRGVPLGVLWDWLKDHVHPRLAGVRIDLRPALEDLKSVLQLVMTQPGRVDTVDSLDSITVKSVFVAPDGLQVDLGMQIPDSAGESAPEPAEGLTPAELARFEAAWKAWDGFITFIVKHFATGTAEPEVRRELLNVLIEARYDLLGILAADRAQAQPDPVRSLFMDTWTRLAPVLRKLSPEMPGERGLNLLSFITAADALHTLDALGPELDLDISLDGLRRLARILAPDSEADPLRYQEQVDPELRELFDFGPPLPLPPIPGADQQGWWRGILPDARAEISVDEKLVERLNRWVPPPEELDSYLQSVHRLLAETGSALAADSDLDPEYHDLFRTLVMATAWQETCWRQFTRVDDKVVTIRSPAGAVGMMQVVPNVWRGFYDPGALSSNIGYNAAAGGEILMHYLQKYAIARGEAQQAGGRDNLAWATYAAYNGGPRHLERYRKGDTSEGLRKIDQSFRDKFEQMRKGDALAVRACYTS